MSTEIQHDKKDEFEASRPEEQAVRDTTSASGNGKSRPQDVASMF
ncbi:hypothetical protein Pint_11180 [Pistacia integerrima]|uniref:Uncharacterized protein n=1 Tax=Pistacia integerrima TaxID=434235 RepID=A0ACC0XIA8_9ROSI|nr:hypothetical protein Pint_11180 [Pistacia integerrima]